MIKDYKFVFLILFSIYLIMDNVSASGDATRPIKNQKRVYPKRVSPGYAQGPVAKIPQDSKFIKAPNFLNEMEFDVEVGPRKEDCYWQYVKEGSTFYVGAQIIKGGEGSFGLGVRNPNGDIVLPYSWSPAAEYKEEKAQEGYYCVCLDNFFSGRSGNILVKLYMSTLHKVTFEKIHFVIKVSRILFS